MNKIIKILLIEDDYDDIELLQDALQEQSIPHKMHVIKDGGQVAGYLKNSTEVPDVIVMDLNLPKVHGREIIKTIKSLEPFKEIPLLILTTSSSQNDMNYAYKEGASRYLIKPTTLPGIREVISTITHLAV